MTARERIIVLARGASALESATVRIAAAISRQAGLAVEFVELPRTGVERLASYARWSGASLLCTGVSDHHHRRLLTLSAALVGTLPVLVVGPRCQPARAQYRRVVAALGRTSRSEHVVDVAAWLAHRIAAELVLTEVFTPGAAAGEVPQIANLHRLAKRVVPPVDTFDALHDHRAADGILRFVGLDGDTIIVLGCRSHRHGRRLGGHVTEAVVRRAPAPVLLVPAA